MVRRPLCFGSIAFVSACLAPRVFATRFVMVPSSAVRSAVAAQADGMPLVAVPKPNTSRCRSPETRPAQRLDRLHQARVAPVEDMVVRKNTAVDPSCREAGDVRRMHAVVDALVPTLVARGDAGLEVDDPRVRVSALELVERIAPDVREVHRTDDGTVGALGELHVPRCAGYRGLIQPGVARVRQHLSDAPAGHHVAAEEQRQRRACHEAPFGSSATTVPSHAGRARGHRACISRVSIACGGALRPICVTTTRPTRHRQSDGSASSIVRCVKRRRRHMAPSMTRIDAPAAKRSSSGVSRATSEA